MISLKKPGRLKMGICGMCGMCLLGTIKMLKMPFEFLHMSTCQDWESPNRRGVRIFSMIFASLSSGYLT